jgi:hypothetical protein
MAVPITTGGFIQQTFGTDNRKLVTGPNQTTPTDDTGTPPKADIRINLAILAQGGAIANPSTE